MAENNKDNKDPTNDNSIPNPNLNDNDHENNNGNPPTKDIEMTDKSTNKHSKSKSSNKKDSKRHHRRYRSHKSRSPSRSRSRDNKSNKSRSGSIISTDHSDTNSSHHSHSRHRSSHRRSHSHRRNHRSHSRSRRNHRSRRDRDYRRSHRSHRSNSRRYKHRDRRHRRHRHSSVSSSDNEKDNNKKNNNTITGPSMDIKVTVFPKSTPGESKVITLSISRSSTVSDFKGTLCSRGFNVFLQYNLLINDHELDISDDRLLCIHVGIKPNENEKYITVKPKENGITVKPIEVKEKEKEKEKEKVEVVSDNNKYLADQIEMYKAYEEMFGVEEAAGMMGLDATEVKKLGIELIISRLENEKKLKTTTNTNKKQAPNPYDYSEELLYASRHTGTVYNENLVDNDTAIGTTHTAGGGTVSRPPPEHVSETACIFVGDLHPMVTRSDLLSVFSQIGSVQWIQLFDCHKQMNRPFNFAFVYFEDLLCARNAISTLNYTKFYGSPCRLMWKQEKNSCNMWTDCNIIVKNLPPNTDSRILHNVFSKFGKILSSKVKTTSTGRTLPYGYVQYGNRNGADAAIIASDRGELSVNGHQLTAEWFKSREDRAFRQIYVKNIPSSWSDTDLLNLFEAQTLGKIKSFTVKHSPYGRWACISFHEPHHAVKAIDKLNNCPTGDPLCPNLSVSRFMYKTERDKFKTLNIIDTPIAIEQQQQQPIQQQQQQQQQQQPAINQCYSIYVGNVPLQLTDEHMRQLFEPFGAVISAAVVQKTQDYKYGFVNFQQPQDAARALVTMNGKSIGGKTLQVKPANTDMSKAIAITQAANKTHNTLLSLQQKQCPKNNNHTQKTTNTNITPKEAKEILLIKDPLNPNGKALKEKVWKVQYGEDWHEYDTTLAAIVEQLNIGEQIQITLADSNYIITRIQNDQAMQKNCASGTMRKVVRSQRDLQ